MIKVRFIAPIPNPLNGHSYISGKLLSYLVSEKYILKVINLNSKNPYERIFKFFLNLFLVFLDSFSKKVTYLTISESLLGNLRDLFIYMILFFQLERVIIHLHGGSIKKDVFDKSKFLFLLNKFFLARVGHIIVSGNLHKDLVNFVDQKKVSSINNFADSELIIEKKDLSNKLNSSPVKILYCSSMREKKGYLILLNSFIRLSEHLNCDAELHFLGSFTSKIDEKLFLNKIASYKNVQFHGFKINSEKNNFFKNSHIFCLPSKYDEGQPISIIEALYAGCAIVSTNSNGIKSMFNSNSYLDFDHSKEKNLDDVLKKILENQNYRNDLMIKSFKNKSKFSERFFKDSISKIIQNLSLNQ